ncbi:decaprenyl-phosphate phosphoribosyltransferase [Patescibacteria group bacterium]|nr:decaprenyl-phosphate phosphoribosyltransferase [Patescibacteria group bacterium]
MKSLTDNTLFLIFKSARPRQWIKNIALYAALIFSGFFFYNPIDDIPYFVTVTLATIIFSILTSSIYIMNDIIDCQADQKHPFKKKRPIASGKLPVPIALFSSIVGLSIVFLSSFWLSSFFRLMIAAYFFLQLAYATKLKHIAILDVVSIASGFLIRIYAGAVVVNLHMSVWFLLTVVSVSLFLAVGKRQSERTLLNSSTKENLGETRVSLKRYSQRLLDQYTGMFANATWLSYALFAFQDQTVRPDIKFATFYGFLPKTLQSQKLLMLTVPFVIYGVMRYLQLVYEDNQGESPERVLLRDTPLLATVFLFGLSVMIIIYVLS